ncbi:MAG: hypothetical protein IJ634_07830 [Bacteroidales bacterium]|nr:hypothetical protein [Bacteroidales bacterium]
MKKSTISTVMALVSLTMLPGCKQQGSEADSVPGMQVVIEGFTDTVELSLVPMDAPDPEPAVKPARKPVAAVTQAPAPKKAVAPKATGKAETIYVETEGAQGRVWGHVTMRGDRGTGTIHDWDENTLSVSVTRHGNELFAVDQNSRQYVFKLKNK